MIYNIYICHTWCWTRANWTREWLQTFENKHIIPFKRGGLPYEHHIRFRCILSSSENEVNPMAEAMLKGQYWKNHLSPQMLLSDWDQTNSQSQGHTFQRANIHAKGGKIFRKFAAFQKTAWGISINHTSGYPPPGLRTTRSQKSCGPSTPWLLDTRVSKTRGGGVQYPNDMQCPVEKGIG